MLRAASQCLGKGSLQTGGLQLVRQTCGAMLCSQPVDGSALMAQANLHSWSTTSINEQKPAWMHPVFRGSFGTFHSVRGIGSPAAAQTIQEAPRREDREESSGMSSAEDSNLSEEEAQHKAERELGGGIPTSKGGGRHGDTTSIVQSCGLMTQPSYDPEFLETVRPKHKPPEGILEHMALYGVRTMRFCFDKITGYSVTTPLTEKQWLRRILFLEAIAGVPGMVGGMMRHMRSLRSMKRDNGWIHTLLEEAENERMHLLTFLELQKPSIWMRMSVLLAQGMFFNFYLACYIISPRLCHSSVGFLEEEAVRTYTHAIDDIDAGRIPEWTNKEAPDIAIEYWSLGEGAKMRQLLLAVRADEASHNHVNHTFARMDFCQGSNPFAKNAHVLP